MKDGETVNTQTGSAPRQFCPHGDPAPINPMRNRRSTSAAEGQHYRDFASPGHANVNVEALSRYSADPCKSAAAHRPRGNFQLYAILGLNAPTLGCD